MDINYFRSGIWNTSHLLATDKLRYFAQPRLIIANYGAVDDNADNDDDDSGKSYFIIIGLRMGKWIEGCTSQITI